MLNKMPRIALGTWQVKDSLVIEKVVEAALTGGYKHIDTAQIYYNEEHIGNVLSRLNIKRENYWITTKIWPLNFRYNAYLSVQKSLERLQTSYVDTFLLHASGGRENNLIAYKELMKARANGLVRTIGVSNFSIEQIQDIRKHTGEYPKYNQIIFSVKQRIIGLESFCKEKGIELMGYSTISPYYKRFPHLSKGNLLEEERKVIEGLADKHKTTAAVIILRWAMDKDYVILPKSTKPERVVANLDVLKTQLSKQDILKLDKMVDYSDKEWKEDMRRWKARDAFTDQQQKVGLRVSPESDIPYEELLAKNKF